MKFQIMSDMHQEGSNKPLITKEMLAPGIDALLLAGDICNRPLHYLKELGVPIKYVMGNHEFYGRSWKDALGEYRIAFMNGNVELMEMDTEIIGNVRLIAATLWTDNYYYNSKDYSLTYAGENHSRFMMDSRAIFGFNVREMEGRHKQALEYIRTKLKEPHDGPTIVMTHHTPSFKSVHERYTGDPSNAFFSSHLDHVIEEFQPDFWVHGHTHDSHDYKIGKTRVVCNPRGYRNYKGEFENEYFLDRLVIETP